MTDQQQQHSFTPPTELVHKWALEAEDGPQPTEAYSLVGQIAAKAAQWGADQELEACCEWLCTVERWKTVAEGLRTSRRPKPLSLKEQALDELTAAEQLYPADWSTVRRALEALD
jgi:hypothetical protein